MGPGLLILAALATPLPRPTQDTSTFSTPEARALIARAQTRHHAQDSSVADYQARLRYRLSVALGRRRWGNPPPLAAEEQEARVAWRLPNDLRVDIVGQRSRTREAGAGLFSSFDSPWFVPRGLSDSVRIFGADFPDRAALHPLAADGPEWYRYALGDTVVIGTPDGRRIRLAEVDVVPKRPGPALIAGKLWLDLATAEVVRLAFRYVGTALWVTPDSTDRDSSSARRANRIINRILSLDADLEYALQEGKYWMPYRQVLSGQVQVPLVSDVFVPFQAVTTFADYEINTGKPLVFRLPLPDSVKRRTREERRAERDSLRDERRGRPRAADSTLAREVAGRLPGGGRYEIRRAPRDSLHRYAEWGDSLKLQVTEEDDRRLQQTKRELADLVERLPNDITGRRTAGFAFERLADAFRFNRVQGTSVGLGYAVDIRPLHYTSLYGTARFGFSDHRPMARLALVRDAPAGKLTVAAYRDLSEADPFSRGLSAANSIRAVTSARDEGDYFLASGGSLAYETSLSRGVDLSLGLRVEAQRSVTTRAKAWLNDAFGGDGVLGPNPPIDPGDFVAPLARVGGRAGRAAWWLAGDALSDVHLHRKSARLFGEWRQPIGGRTGLTTRLRAGLATRPTLEQMEFRAGGQGSVRGFAYGAERGQALWAVQTDLAPFRRTLRPVVFLDLGQAGQLDSLSSRKVLVGGGVGLSLLNGLVRLDLSHPLSPWPSKAEFRLDLVFGAAR